MGSETVKYYSWGRDDKVQLLKESSHKNIDFLDSFNRWVDFQKAFMRLHSFSRRIKLIEAVELAASFFEGAPHNALIDAHNGGRLYLVAKNKEQHSSFKQLLKTCYDNFDSCTVPIGKYLSAQISSLNTQVFL